MNNIVIIGENGNEESVIVKLPITLAQFKRRYFAGYPNASIINNNVNQRLKLINELQTYTHLKIIRSYYEFDLMEETGAYPYEQPRPEIDIFQTPYQSGNFKPIIHSFVVNQDSTQTELFKFHYPSTEYETIAKTLTNKTLGFMDYNSQDILVVKSQLETRYQKPTF